MLASAAPPTEQGSTRCSSSERGFLWTTPPPSRWTFRGQGPSTGCCRLSPPHPTPMWRGGPQGSSVKPAGVSLLMFASNIWPSKKPSTGRNKVRLLFCSQMQLGSQVPALHPTSTIHLTGPNVSSFPIISLITLQPQGPSPSSCLFPVHS